MRRPPQWQPATVIGAETSFIATKRPPPMSRRVALQQEFLRTPPRGQADAIVEQPPVAAIRCVPGDVAALRLREFPIVRRQKPVAIDGRAKDNSRIEVENRFLERRQELVGK